MSKEGDAGGRGFRNSINAVVRRILRPSEPKDPLWPQDTVGVRVPRKPSPSESQAGAKIDPRKN